MKPAWRPLMIGTYREPASSATEPSCARSTRAGDSSTSNSGSASAASPSTFGFFASRPR